jgi:hypothetical protein
MTSVIPKSSFGAVTKKSWTPSSKTTPAMNASAKKLKILVLHSNRQNASIFMNKTKQYLEKVLRATVQFTYCDAPHVYTPKGQELERLFHERDYSVKTLPNMPIVEVDDPIARDETKSNLEGAKMLPTPKPTVRLSSAITRQWWNATDDPKTMVYDGLEDSIAYVDALFQHTAFDGILGFSQGGALTGILAGMVHDHRKHGSIAGRRVPVENIARSLRFVVVISGFYVRDVRPIYSSTVLETIPEEHRPELVAARSDKIEIPSFHIWGLTDTLVDPWRSAKLAEAFADMVPTNSVDNSSNSIGKAIATHPLTHFTKAIKYWPIAQLVKWLEQFIDPSDPSDSSGLSNDKQPVEESEEERERSDLSSSYDLLASQLIDEASMDIRIDLFMQWYESFAPKQVHGEVVHFFLHLLTTSKYQNCYLLYRFLYLLSYPARFSEGVTSTNEASMASTLRSILSSSAPAAHEWKTIIAIDTNMCYDGYRRVIVKAMAQQLQSEYRNLMKYQSDSGEKSLPLAALPSPLVQYAPRYNQLYRTTRLYHDLAIELGRILNIFNATEDSPGQIIDESIPESEDPKRKLLLSFNQYRQVISKLSQVLKASTASISGHVQASATNHQKWKKRPERPAFDSKMSMLDAVTRDNHTMTSAFIKLVSRNPNAIDNSMLLSQTPFKRSDSSSSSRASRCFRP